MTEDSHCRTRLEFSEEGHMQREKEANRVSDYNSLLWRLKSTTAFSIFFPVK